MAKCRPAVGLSQPDRRIRVRQVRNWLLRHLRDGQWRAGHEVIDDGLRALSGLAVDIALLRRTLRQTIRLLEREGLLACRKERGTLWVKRT